MRLLVFILIFASFSTQALAERVNEDFSCNLSVKRQIANPDRTLSESEIYKMNVFTEIQSKVMSRKIYSKSMTVNDNSDILSVDNFSLKKRLYLFTYAGLDKFENFKMKLKLSKTQVKGIIAQNTEHEIEDLNVGSVSLRAYALWGPVFSNDLAVQRKEVKLSDTETFTFKLTCYSPVKW